MKSQKNITLFYQVEGNDPCGLQPHYWCQFSSGTAKTYKGGLRKLKRMKKDYSTTNYKFRLIERIERVIA
jgi:hypothetical protein